MATTKQAVARPKKLAKRDLAKLVVDERRLMHLDLVGLAEASQEILHVERARIGKWRHNGILLSDGERIPFPEPITFVTTCAEVKCCEACDTLYPPTKDRCVNCGSSHAMIEKDYTKLAATPLWWGDDIRELARTLARSKPRD